MALKDWSLTAGDNDSVTDGTYGNISWPEGMNPNIVNDSARAEMAHVRAFYETLEWRDWGHTPTRTGDATFEISSASTLASVYTVGRRIRCTDSSTLYGIITASSYAGSTQTVTVLLDSGALSASLSAVSVGFDPTNSPIKRPVNGGMAYRTSDLAVDNGFDEYLRFDTIAYDTCGCLSYVTPAGGNTTLITVPTWATYMQVSLFMKYEANAAGFRGGRLVLTNSAGTTNTVLDPSPEVIIAASSAGVRTSTAMTTWKIPVTGGAYYKVNSYQTSGGSLNLLDESAIGVEFF